ncbi:hypothetical protein [Christiangramia sp. SM2212]|uniref:DUF4352 domain-containing protein n=1 Tax=Christiangramia sediminicola TaxID=3073267 RepID=A0ABU1ELU4_9FLAO|nr:hypothetical protein [Christiangramia sp. SM2212]MDR5589228.1 hypothetical protein [Christiangramia sp. SM2212]
MNRITRIVLSILLINSLSSCFSNRIVHQNEPLQLTSNEVKFQLVSVSQNNQLNTRGMIFSQTVRDGKTGKIGKFYMATIEIQNNSKQQKSIDLGDILLCNADNSCLEPVRYDMKSAIDARANQIMKLKPNQEKGRKIYFAGSKSFVPETIMLKDTGEFIKFSYKK